MPHQGTRTRAQAGEPERDASEIGLKVETPGDWTTEPSDVKEALDALAAGGGGGGASQLTDLSDVDSKTGSGNIVVMSNAPTFLTGVETPAVTHTGANFYFRVTRTAAPSNVIIINPDTDPAGVCNLVIDGSITLGGTVDTRDVATDGAKLDGIEALANVTDATNVNAAGAVMETDYVAQGDILVASGASTPAALTVGAAGTLLGSDGTDATWGQVPTKNRTIRTPIRIYNPLATDDFPIDIRAAVPITITEIYAITDTGTFTFKLYQRVRSAPFSGGQVINTNSIVADSTGEEDDNTWTDATVPVDSGVYVVASAIASTPGIVEIEVEYTID